MTLRASGPFCPSDGSNSTFAPSVRVLKPSPAIALKWTNTSLPPSSGVMKPYPFASLNHLTVPVLIRKHLPYNSRTCKGRRLQRKPGLVLGDLRIPGRRSTRAHRDHPRVGGNGYRTTIVAPSSVATPKPRLRGISHA